MFLSVTAGALGFSQIVVSVKMRKQRGVNLTALTICIWLVLLALYASAIVRFLPDYQMQVLIALTVGVLLSLLPKRR